MAVRKYTYAEFVMLNPEILSSSGGDINNSVAVAYHYQLLDVRLEELLQRTDDDLAYFIDERVTAVGTASHDDHAVELWENPRNLLRSKNKVTFYYCAHCGTPLRPGTCKGKGIDKKTNRPKKCNAKIINIKAIRENRAPTLPGVVYRQITMKNNRGDGPKSGWGKPRYEFPIRPVNIID